jgi:hypothetical protein
VSKKGIVAIKLTCPGTALVSCAGTDSLRYKKLKLGSKKFAIATAKTASVKIKLSKKARKLLAGKKKLKATQTVVSHDSRKLSKTNSAKLTLKRAG